MGEARTGAIRIRRATPSDAALIVGLLIASKEASFPDTIDPHDRDEAFWLARWSGYLTEGSRARGSLGDGFALIGELDDVPVGFAAYHHTRRFGTEAELQSIYVLKDAQGRGVGTALLREIAGRLAADGTRTMCVGHATGSRYNRFYQKHGATPIGPEYSAWRDVGALAARLGAVLHGE